LCDVGQLLPLVPLSYTLVINVPPASTEPFSTWLTVSWNEGWSTNGSNADYTFANGAFSVGTASCTTATSSYFLPDEQVDLDNGGGTCQGQTASVMSGDPLTGIGGFASLGIDSSFSVACPSDVHSCFGVTVSASVVGGVEVPGGVEWTVRWYGTKSLTGVIHFGDDYGPLPDNDPADYTLIPFTKKNLCVDTASVTDLDCWIIKLSSPGNEKPVWFQATFRTPDNGRGGGYT
jgi:hypothetical protein